MMRKYILLLLATFFFVPMQAKKRSDVEERMINRIWARTDMPEFNERTVFEKYKDEPVVVLAKYHELTDITQDGSVVLDLISPFVSQVMYATLDRCMVKINSNSAIHEFSTVQYEKGSPDNVYVVGIRVYKSDGTVVNVNPDDYIKVSTDLKSKREKDNVVKIAVPNLQKGDVIDYFMYKEISTSTEALKEETLNAKCPIQSYRFKGVFSRNAKFKYWVTDPVQPQVETVGKVECIGFNVIDLEPFKRDIFSNSVGSGILFRYDFHKIQVSLLNIGAEKGIKPMEIIENPTEKSYLNLVNNMLFHGYLKDWLKQIKTYLKNHPNLTEEEKAEIVYYHWMQFSIPQDAIRSYPNVSYIGVLRKLNINYEVAAAVNRYKVRGDDAVKTSDFCEIVKLSNGAFYHVYDNGLPSLWDYNNNIEGSKMKFGNSTDWEFVPVTTAEKNRTDVSIHVSFNKEDDLSLDVERNVSLSGNVKHAHRNLLGTYLQWDSVVRNRYGLPNGLDENAKGLDKYTARVIAQKRLAVEEEALSQGDAFEQEADGYFVGRVGNLKNYHIDSYGLFLDDSLFRYQSDVVLEGEVKTADKSRIVNIGHLLSYLNLSDLKETRKNDIVLKNTFLDTYQINFQIPAGYEVRNVEAFEKNISNSCGSFLSHAKVEGGTLVVNVAWRINGLKYPASEWKNILEILRGYQSFFNTSAVMTLR